MTSSSTKLHAAGGLESDSGESSNTREDDIDEYLEAALEEMDKEENVITNGESPSRSRNMKGGHQGSGSGRPPHSVGEFSVPSDSRPPEQLDGESSTPQTRQQQQQHLSTPSHQLISQRLESNRNMMSVERPVNVRDARQAAVTFANQSRGMQAAAHGDIDLLQRLVLDKDIDFASTTRDSHGSTPIHKAAEGGHLDCLRWLIDQAPPEAVHIQDVDFITPALVSITNGHIECLKILVEAADGEIETFDKGLTLLHHAAYHGQDECLSFLLSKVKETQSNGSMSLADDTGVTPAHIAARQGHLHCLQVLVEANVDVTNEDEDGQTPIDWANQAGRRGCSHYLLLVDSCHTLSATVSKLQGQLGRVKDENKQLKAELSQVRRSQASSEQQIRRECEETIDEVRKEYVDMTVRLIQKIDRSQNAKTQPVDERVISAERKADEAAAEARQLHRRLQDAYRRIDSLMISSRESSQSPSSHSSPLPTGIEATPLLKEYLSRMTHQVPQGHTSKPAVNDRPALDGQLNNGGTAGTMVGKPNPPPRFDSWQKSLALQRVTDSSEWSDQGLHGSSNTLQSSGSSVEI
ncbi:synphilin-1-like isoform X2 [Corticium candelabrum]|nr:synphilin-1-like isoform X2 [Corticium candelabrum]